MQKSEIEILEGKVATIGTALDNLKQDFVQAVKELKSTIIQTGNEFAKELVALDKEPTGIHKAMIGIMTDIEHIKKGNYNKSQKYRFRGIDDLYNALHNIFVKHKVFITSKELSHHRTERKSSTGGVLTFTMVKTEFKFNSIDGSSVTTEGRGEGMDSGDKSTGKSASTAMKYALMQTFLIPTEELIDLNVETGNPTPAPSTQIDKAPPPEQTAPKPKKATKKQLEAIEKKLKEYTALNGASHEKYNEDYNSKKEDLLSPNASKIITMLNDKINDLK